MKVLLIATVQSHICQFHKPLVAMLHEHGCEVHVAARDNLAEKNGLKLNFVERVFDVPFQRSPFSLKNLSAYRQIKQIIQAENYDVIHCNTPVGGVLGRLAARKARRTGTKVFYTAHGFHFYRGAPIKNWLFWYPVEMIMSHFCDKLIAITEEDYQLAKQRFFCHIEHIHGVGVYPERFHVLTDVEQLALRKKENLDEKDYVALCVGELNTNKNQDKLISAAAQLRKAIPGLKVLLAGNGAREEEYRRQINEFGLHETVRLLGYRTDLERITPIANLVVSCSRREGLPLNILEAMLCCKPVVASHNRGHDELVEERKTGFLVRPDNVDAYADRIAELYRDPSLALYMGENGKKKAQLYTAEAVTAELRDIYGFSKELYK